VHPGYEDVTNEEGYFEISYGTVRNKVFRRALSHFLKDTNFIVGDGDGAIQLLEVHQFAFSTYGTSIPDFCVISRLF